jgi:carboxyl-terminal processing protease
MRSHLRAPRLLLAALLLVAACEPALHPTEVPGSDARMSAQARRYVDSALYLMQSYSLQKHEVDWPWLREETYARANGAAVPAQTYAALQRALETLNEHSFFIPPTTGVGGPTTGLWPPLLGRSFEGGRIGYIRTATFSGSDPDGHAQDYHDFIRENDTQATCGWVVDLRGNPGGNMWPMLAGVGPILGEGSPGAFIDADGVRTPWYYANGVAGVERNGSRLAASRAREPYRLHRPNPPVTVLTGVNTASAAEAVAIAFRGRPDTRSFGLMTRGLPTANTSFDMPDGAVVVLTTSWETDRTGTRYEGRIEPDETVIGVTSGNPASDDALGAALAWLNAQPACQG